MTKNQIRETVEKQLQLLSDRSREIIAPLDLVALTGAMIDCADWLLDNPEIMETTNTIVRAPEETVALAATIRDTLSKVAAERSIRQQLVPQRMEKESQPNDLTNQFETFHR